MNRKVTRDFPNLYLKAKKLFRALAQSFGTIN